MDDLNQYYPSTDEGKIGFWDNEIDLALKWVEPAMNAGNRVVKLYNNMPHGIREEDLEASGPENIQRVKGSLVFAWVDGAKANMVDRNPEFSVSPETAASAGGIDVVQRASNYWYDYTKQVEQDDQIALDAFLLPYGIKKIGWNAVIEQQNDLYLTDAGITVIEDPDEENIAMMIGTITKPTVLQDHEEHIETHITLLQTPDLPPEVAGLVEEHIKHHKDLTGKIQPAPDTRIQWESPFGSRWAPDDFAMDAYTGMNMRGARWIGWRVRAPLYWWKGQKNFKNTDDLDITQMSLSHDNRLLKQSHDKVFQDYQMVEGWEIWARDFPISRGKRRNMLITYIPGHKKLLREDDEWPYKNFSDYPAGMLKFQDNIKTWINKPLMTLSGADNIQQLVNEFFDSMLYTMRKAKNLWLYDTDLMTKDEFEEVVNAPDGSAYGVAGLSMKAGKPVQPVEFMRIPPEKDNMVHMLTDFMDRTAGNPQPQRSPRTQTATESAIVDRRNTAREDQRVQRFEHMQIETAEKFWKLHQQFLPERDFLIDPRINKWATVSEEIARGQYRFRFDISPSKQSRAVERKNWMDLYNLLVGSIPAYLNLGLQPPNIVKALELLLRRGFDIRDPETLLPASESEFQKQMQETLGDHERVSKVVDAFRTLSGGGNFGPEGGAPLLDPQQYASSPNTAVRQQDQAQRGAT